MFAKLAFILLVLCVGWSTSLKTSSSAKTEVIEDLVVTKITDGDTIHVKDPSNSDKIYKVRFICVDAPERSQMPWGTKAAERLSKLVPIGSKVSLIGSALDRYGRRLSEVLNSSGVNVNEQMVKDGLALKYPMQRNCDKFGPLEQIAKSNRAGVWNDDSFVTPWDYRKQKRNERKSAKRFRSKELH